MLFGSVMTFYVTINVLCSIIIVIMIVMMKFGVMHETEQKIFFNLCVQCLLFFFLDVFWVLLDGAGFAGARTLNLCVNAAYFSQLGILCFFWSRYSFFLAEYRIRLTDLRILYCSPLFINVAMSVASIWTGWFFNVDAEGRYHRGDILFINVLLVFLYLLTSFFVAFFMVKRKKNVVKKNRLYAVSALGVIPFLTEILQIQLPGLSIICAGTTIGLIVVFVEIQKEMISIDPLTKLNNRNQASLYLDARFKQTVPGKRLYQFVMDLDKFKQINDHYGHIEGDRALLAVANVLKEVCGPRGHFISRFGGDEFVVFANLSTDTAAKALCETISARLAEESSGFPFKLSMSFGFAFRNPGESEQELFARADSALYEAKTAREAG